MGDYSRIDFQPPTFFTEGLDARFLNWLADNFQNAQGEINARRITFQVNPASVGTPAGTGETTLFTCPILANYIISSGYLFKFRAFGTCTDGAATKRLRGYLGTNVVIDTGTFSGSSKHWELDFTIAAIDGTHQNAFGKCIINGQNPIANFTALTQDMTVDKAVSITGQNGTANLNDILLKTVHLEISRQ